MRRCVTFLGALMIALLFVAAFPLTAQLSQSAPVIGPDEVGAPCWGFKVKLPAGWSVAQKTERLAVLGCQGLHGAIVMFPHALPDMARLNAKMKQGLTDENVQLDPLGPPLRTGEIIAGDYEGEYDGLHVKARWAGSLSPWGGGAFIISSARPQYFTPELAALADSMVRGIEYFKGDYEEMTRFFTGTWEASGDAPGIIELMPDGTCRGIESDAGSAGPGAAAARSSMKWTILGNRFEGALIITGEAGAPLYVEYRVRSEKGQIHWDEYRIGGKEYIKKK